MVHLHHHVCSVTGVGVYIQLSVLYSSTHSFNRIKKFHGIFTFQWDFQKKQHGMSITDTKKALYQYRKASKKEKNTMPWSNETVTSHCCHNLIDHNNVNLVFFIQDGWIDGCDFESQAKWKEQWRFSLFLLYIPFSHFLVVCIDFANLKLIWFSSLSYCFCRRFTRRRMIKFAC